MQHDGNDAQYTPSVALDAARAKLFGYFGTGTPPRWHEPGNDKGSAQMDADVLRLSAMTAADLYEDPEALATLLMIADYQNWT